MSATDFTSQMNTLRTKTRARFEWGAGGWANMYGTPFSLLFYRVIPYEILPLFFHFFAPVKSIVLGQNNILLKVGQYLQLGQNIENL